jgi:hypothetical protein
VHLLLLTSSQPYALLTSSQPYAAKQKQEFRAEAAARAAATTVKIMIIISSRTAGSKRCMSFSKPVAAFRKTKILVGCSPSSRNEQTEMEKKVNFGINGKVSCDFVLTYYVTFIAASYFVITKKRFMVTWATSNCQAVNDILLGNAGYAGGAGIPA